MCSCRVVPRLEDSLHRLDACHTFCVLFLPSPRVQDYALVWLDIVDAARSHQLHDPEANGR